MALWRWIVGLFRKPPVSTTPDETYYAPDHRRAHDAAARNSARAAESGASSIGIPGA